MSLALGYASSEDEDLEKLSKDAFGLSSMLTSKKPKVAEFQSTSTNAAPDVLSEVMEIYSNGNDPKLTCSYRIL